MNDKANEIIDGTFYPKERTLPIADGAGELVGDYWRIWKRDSKCFLEYDEGHFAPKMVTIEITEDEYDLISARPAGVKEVIRTRRPG